MCETLCEFCKVAKIRENFLVRLVRHNLFKILSRFLIMFNFKVKYRWYVLFYQIGNNFLPNVVTIIVHESWLLYNEYRYLLNAILFAKYASLCHLARNSARFTYLIWPLSNTSTIIYRLVFMYLLCANSCPTACTNSAIKSSTGI